MQPKESKSNWHFKISIIKSGIRIWAGGALCWGFPLTAGILLIIAETLGIAEEL